jgi:hypothetical protein
VQFLISPLINNNLTKEQKNILKILSNGSDLQYQELIRNESEHIDKLVQLYYQRKPLIDELKAHEIHIKDINNWEFSQLDDDTFKKAIPILITWLKRKDVSYHVKDVIVDVLIESPIAKQYAFDIILQEFKTANRDYKDEWGYPSTLFMTIGNALLRWVDDKNAAEIFDFLKDKKLKEDNFLLASLANFKKLENTQKAKDILKKELQNKTVGRDRLFTAIATLRRLKLQNAEDVLDLLKPFSTHKDTEIKNEAKKAIAKFEKFSK